MSPKKKSGGNKGGGNSGGAKIHKSNISKNPSGKGSAAKKIFTVFVILLVLTAAVFLFNKLGGCSMCRNISEYKESYDELSGSDTQDITSGESNDGYGGGYTPGALPSGSDKDEPKVDNSSDASILDMFTSCGGSGQNSDSDSSERIIEVSPTDIGQFELWEQPENDAAYRSMMRDKVDEYITLFTRLDDMREGLSECKNAEQVEKNERYAVLKNGLLNWCGGAQSFSALNLNEDSREAAELASQIAADTRVYLAIYPTLVSTGDGAGQARELADSIVDNLQQITSIITANS